MTDITKTKLYHIACSDGKKWLASQPDLQTAWDTCTRTDWMLWCLKNIGWRDDKALRLFACWCVRNTPLNDGRTAWDLLTDERSRNAVEVAERFANGEATEAELSAAGVAARDAQDAQDAERAAAWVASWVAARDAQDAQDAARVAWDAAWVAARDASANQLRVMVSNPFAGNEVAPCR